jgi:polar amino acid transport system substrate-binding protein
MTAIGRAVVLGVLGTALAAGLSGEAAPAGVRVITEESPPGEVVGPDGRATGPTVEFVRELMRGLAVRGDIEVLPWKRGYEAAKRGPQVALFETTRTPERETQFRWVGPIKRIQWTFFARKDSPVRIRSLADARAVGSVAVYAGDSKGDYLKAQGFTTPVQAFKMLMAGRADLWMFSDIGSDAVAREAGFSPADIKPVYVSRQEELYIAFSLDTPATTVRAWQDRLDALKRDGTLARYYRGTYPDDMIRALSVP